MSKVRPPLSGTYVTQAEKLSALPTGALGGTSRLDGHMSDQALLSSGRLNLVGLYLTAGASISNITFMSGGTPAGTPTNQWFAIYSSALGKLAVTADDTTTAWAASATKTLAVASGPYVVPSSGFYYLGICVVAATPPSLAGPTTRASAMALTPKKAGTSTTGLTDPASAPSTAAAITANQTGFPFAYVS